MLTRIFDLVFHKSCYIKVIREAVNFTESYFREKFIDIDKKFISNTIESLTAAKLITELEISSVRIIRFVQRLLNFYLVFFQNRMKINH